MTEPSVTESLQQYAQRDYIEARKEFLKSPEITEVALRFGMAAFEWAVLNSEERADIAGQGINACQAALETDPNSGAAFYYLAMNLGQLARTKTLGALKLVRKMEKAFVRAIQSSPKVHFGGPHRSLGLLYAKAPRWISVGNKKKARKHLEQAVTQVPEYPGNRLALMEAYLKWGKKQLAQGQLVATKKAIVETRKTLKGVRWEVTRIEWAERLRKIEEKLR